MSNNKPSYSIPLDDIRAAGRYFAYGVFDALARLVLIGLVLIVFLYLLTPTDDTDYDYLTRSGLALHVDYGTGCEYLVTSKGGIIKREKPCGKGQ